MNDSDFESEVMQLNPTLRSSVKTSQGEAKKPLSFESATPKIPKRQRFRWVHLIILIFIIASIYLLISPKSLNQSALQSPSVESPHSPSQYGPLILLQKSKIGHPLPSKTPRGDYRKRFLCQILNNTNCQSYFIADVVDLFWVVAPIYSFDTDSDTKYRDLHEEFKSYIKSYGLKHITIEAIRYPDNLKERPWSREPNKYSATIPGNEPYDIQVYYYNMSYIRENLLNVAIRKLDKQAPWEYVSWIDAHQYFDNPYWWEEAIYKAEKYGSVQIFDTVIYLTPHNQTGPEIKLSFIQMSLLLDIPNTITTAFGNAYTIARNNYNSIGFIYDECIATGCDCVYVMGSLPQGLWMESFNPTYYKNFEPWVNNAKLVLAKRTFVRGYLKHFYHGGKFPYTELHVAVGNYGFNTSRDIKRDQNFSVYIDNQPISTVVEWIIYDSKQKSAQVLHSRA